MDFSSILDFWIGGGGGVGVPLESAESPPLLFVFWVTDKMSKIPKIKGKNRDTEPKQMTKYKAKGRLKASMSGTMSTGFSNRSGPLDPSPWTDKGADFGSLCLPDGVKGRGLRIC